MTKPIEKYIYLYENLSQELIDQMDAYVLPDIDFKDPFNQVTSLSSLQAILRKTLEDVKNPKFTITQTWHHQDSYILKWRFTGEVSILGTWDLTGLSEIYTDQQGNISKHIDYWDASEGFYMKIPFLGPILRRIRKRLAV